MAPQIIWIILVIVGIASAIMQHNQPYRVSAVAKIGFWIIQLILLFLGGFFAPLGE